MKYTHKVLGHCLIFNSPRHIQVILSCGVFVAEVLPRSCSLRVLSKGQQLQSHSHAGTLWRTPQLSRAQKPRLPEHYF